MELILAPTLSQNHRQLTSSQFFTAAMLCDRTAGAHDSDRASPSTVSRTEWAASKRTSRVVRSSLLEGAVERQVGRREEIVEFD